MLFDWGLDGLRHSQKNSLTTKGTHEQGDAQVLEISAEGGAKEDLGRPAPGEGHEAH
jgi:hypothetical protein